MSLTSVCFSPKKRGRNSSGCPTANLPFFEFVKIRRVGCTCESIGIFFIGGVCVHYERIYKLHPLTVVFCHPDMLARPLIEPDEPAMLLGFLAQALKFSSVVSSSVHTADNLPKEPTSQMRLSLSQGCSRAARCPGQWQCHTPSP